jgi:hypothetical protein
MAHLAAAEVGAQSSVLAKLRRRSGGRLAEDALEAVADESCRARLRLCVAVLSRWELAYPGSERRASFLAAQRERWRNVDDLAPERMEDLARLQGARPLPEGRIPLAEVERLTSLYEQYYHHGAAFDRSVLVEAWRRCKDTRSGVACSEARRFAEQRLGPMHAVASASTR